MDIFSRLYKVKKQRRYKQNQNPALKSKMGKTEVKLQIDRLHGVRSYNRVNSCVNATKIEYMHIHFVLFQPSLYSFPLFQSQLNIDCLID